MKKLIKFLIAVICINPFMQAITGYGKPGTWESWSNSSVSGVFDASLGDYGIIYYVPSDELLVVHLDDWSSDWEMVGYSGSLYSYGDVGVYATFQITSGTFLVLRVLNTVTGDAHYVAFQGV